MYSSSYSQAKYGREAREPPHRAKGKSCGYYMRIIFLFSSLIQSLIIVSLVLFLIYGQPEKSALEKKVEDMEQSFNKLSENNVQLRKDKSELGAQLKARTAEKAALEKEMEKLKTQANSTQLELKTRLTSCMTAAAMKRCPTIPIQTSGSNELKTCQSLNAQQSAMISLIEANFTQMVNYLRQERDNALKVRDAQFQEAITLRRETTMVKEQLSTYTRKCKQDFAESLNGIQTVTRDFLNRINNMFPHQLTFHLTCDSQREQMEKIKNSCTNLSRDVENKFQVYLDNVGNKVAEIQALSSRLEVQNSHLTSDWQQCERSRNQTIAETTRQLQLKQVAHDDQMEKLLSEKSRLRTEKELVEERLALKEKELQSLRGAQGAQPSSRSGVLSGFKPGISTGFTSRNSGETESGKSQKTR
ncbi:plasmalemma vesicle associated protein b [Betta splendens]|uniref:Plasmalemma vesicle associated protein b n=1 Tax=Betta splendens TaxID=158456 RepID=A0A6P7MDR2_BETSP|nr:plasmalemma vesicle associated protein b [Betta splendens]